MDTFLFEYEDCHCSKINREVTITSMVIKDSNEDAVSGRDHKRAVDCNQIEHCGVSTISGEEMIIDWFECTHPKFTGGAGNS